MILTIAISLFIGFVNWVLLKEVIVDWTYYPGSRQEQYFYLLLLVAFDGASIAFFRLLSKKIKNVPRIFTSTILVFLSLLALHDVLYGWGEENLVLEFSILGLTLIYFLYLLWLKKR